MKAIDKAYGKKGRLSLAFFLAAVLIGSAAMIESREVPEETNAKARPVATATVMTHPAEPVLDELDVPEGRTSFKSYMSYHAITNKRSEQYKLQQECWTDSNGMRRFGGTDYVIALGSYYTGGIGDRFRITLDTGEQFNATVGDFKADKHTDSMNQYTPTQNNGKCVLEFIVDTGKLDKTAKRMGDISYIPGFRGNVEKIEKWKE